MTDLQYIINSANLPFDLDYTDTEGDQLFEAVPSRLMAALNCARSHSDTVHAGDAVSAWIAANWRTVLPVLSGRFPSKP